jgi:hypothetical protein
MSSVLGGPLDLRSAIQRGGTELFDVVRTGQIPPDTPRVSPRRARGAAGCWRWRCWLLLLVSDISVAVASNGLRPFGLGLGYLGNNKTASSTGVLFVRETFRM